MTSNNDNDGRAQRAKRPSRINDGRLLFTILGVVAPFVALITALVQERFWIEKGEEQLAAAFWVLQLVSLVAFVTTALRALFGRRQDA